MSWIKTKAWHRSSQLLKKYTKNYQLSISPPREKPHQDYKKLHVYIRESQAKPGNVPLKSQMSDKKGPITEVFQCKGKGSSSKPSFLKGELQAFQGGGVDVCERGILFGRCCRGLRNPWVTLNRSPFWKDFRLKPRAVSEKVKMHFKMKSKDLRQYPRHPVIQCLR